MLCGRVHWDKGGLVRAETSRCVNPETNFVLIRYLLEQDLDLSSSFKYNFIFSSFDRLLNVVEQHCCSHENILRDSSNYFNQNLPQTSDQRATATNPQV